ncbi:MAG TPA: CHRD domain-containing protein [Acidimicrobiia bacterium]|nr:CHRD domain-containing protein [Acidimicrobiia bacterium]
MSRKTRKRALFAGLAVALGVSSLGGLTFNMAQAETSHGADRIARGEALATALDAYTEAARTCDIDASREAYQAAEAIANAVSQDAQFAAVSEYMLFSGVYLAGQVRASLGLAGEVADDYTCEERVDLAEEQAAAWDAILAIMAANSAEGSPLFNDLATLRTVYQGIRLARAELAGDPAANPQTPFTAPDPAAAKEHWLEFVADYPVARELIAFRNADLATEIDGLVAAVTTAFEGDPAQGFPGAAEALTALNSRYNLAQNLVVAAARNFQPSRPNFDPTNWDALDTLDDVLLTIFEVRDLIALGTPEAAAQVAVEYDEWLAHPLYNRRGGPVARADENLAAAVAEYAAAQTPETTQALLDQLLIAEQVFVGQYWGTPELVQYYEENEGPGGEPGPVLPTFVATLTPEANIPPGPAGATGDATIEIDAAAGQVCQVLNYANTGAPLSGAHIHVGAAGVNGPIVVDLQILPSGQEACFAANPAVLGEIVANPAGYYVNLHTDVFPDGVLRGQLSAA